MQGETIGWLCSYTPVEIPMAVGLLPVRLGAEVGVPGWADPRIYRLLCPYVRAVFCRASLEPDSMPRRVVFTRCCDAMVRLHDLWKAYVGGHVDFLDVPKVSSPAAVEYFAGVLRRWAREISPRGSPLKDDALWCSIYEMNRARALFREMFVQLASPTNPLKYSWLRALVRQWLRRPSMEELERIRARRDALFRCDSEASSGTGIVISSTMLDQDALVDLLEGAGFRILGDDECLGERHFHEDVAQAVDPFLALAQRYLRRWPCARMKDTSARLQAIDRLLDRTGAKGLIVLQLKFCDQSGFDLPSLQSHLSQRGVPLLVIENDYGDSALGQIRTRVEAFREMLDEPWE